MGEKSVSELMRLGMRRLASGVCVIAAPIGEEGFAMTASSVTSVSDSPASLLVCINKAVSSQEYFTVCGNIFSVNVLGELQGAISDLCAGREPGKSRFSLGDWGQIEGLPYLADAQTVFFCAVDHVIEYGTHQIVIAKINDVFIGAADVAPLVYVDGSYGQFYRT